MRLLYCTTSAQSADQFLRGQLSWMREQGWEVHVAAANGAELDRVRDRESVTVHPLPIVRDISILEDFKALIRLLRVIRRLRPNVVSAGTPKASLLAMAISCMMRIPKRVYVVRGLRLEGARSPLLRAVLWTAEVLTARLATDVVSVSPSLATELVRTRIAPRQGTLVIGEGSSNGVNASAVREAVTEQARQQVRHTHGIPEDAMVIGYLGRIAGDKGLDTLLSALAREELNRQGPVTLLCVGGVEDQGLLERVLASGPRAIHVRHTDHPWRYLSAMDILCLPTRREGFPNVVLEAASASLPVVATDATGSRDAVVNDVTGIVVPVNDPERLAAALARLIHDPSERARMGEAARRRAETSFSPTRIWKGLDAIYRGERSQDVTCFTRDTNPSGGQN